MIIHQREIHLSTNTGFLAGRVLDNAQILYRGVRDIPFQNNRLLMDGFTPLYLFPDESSIVLTKDYLESLNSKVHLIVPDGSWRQAKKFKRRIPELEKVQSVTLPPGRPSEYYLRRQTKLENVCTYEAIARAIGILEGPRAESQMTEVFKIMVEQFLKIKTSYRPSLQPSKNREKCIESLA